MEDIPRVQYRALWETTSMSNRKHIFWQAPPDISWFSKFQNKNVWTLTSESDWMTKTPPNMENNPYRVVGKIKQMQIPENHATHGSWAHWTTLFCFAVLDFGSVVPTRWASVGIQMACCNLGTVAQLVVTCSVVFSGLFAQSKGSRDALFLDKPHRGLWFWRGRNHFLAMDWVGPTLGDLAPENGYFNGVSDDLPTFSNHFIQTNPSVKVHRRLGLRQVTGLFWDFMIRWNSFEQRLNPIFFKMGVRPHFGPVLSSFRIRHCQWSGTCDRVINSVDSWAFTDTCSDKRTKGSTFWCFLPQFFLAFQINPLENLELGQSNVF